jgi:DNA-binding NarL/FixJ family response regulator
MDGVQSEFATQMETTAPHSIIMDGKAQPSGSILLIDAQRLTRQCMTETLQDLCPDMEIVGLRPDDYHQRRHGARSLLIIINLHGARIGDAVQGLHFDRTSPASPLLFITARDGHREALDAVEHGAMGLVRATASIESLIAAMRLLIAGGRYYSSQALTSPAPAA